MTTPVSGPGFTPNFTASHAVVLDRPIDKVFAMIGTSEGHERVCRLSSLCTAFELLEKDAVALLADAVLSESHVRQVDSSEGGLPRQHFKMTEMVSTFMIKTNVHIEGTLTWDEKRKVALYESIVPANGITVWKLRQFEDLEGNKTRVVETIQGHCPALLRRIVEGQTRRAHTAHMELYHTLF
ncbi:hypothetical protein BDZ89DRAFT_1090244 [Hymenopellis radicata]|nr:hypothetical protein BDZ89DRAFT_1090244 [Hymenopellis radicata]